VVGLDVRLQQGDDRDALSLSECDVVVDEIGVGVNDRELLLRLAAEEVGGTGGLVVQQLAEEDGTRVGAVGLCTKGRSSMTAIPEWNT
jgi:hypothetical protein